MVRGLLRILVGIIGVLALLVAIRLWIAPAEPAAQLGLQAVGRLGLATLRADVAGFFAVGGLFSLLAAVRGDGRLLTPPLALLTLALAGRVLTVVIDGYAPEMLPPMVVEGVLVTILFLARRPLGAA